MSKVATMHKEMKVVHVAIVVSAINIFELSLNLKPFK